MFTDFYIINIRRKGSYDPTYAAAKGGIITFSKSLSMWLAPKLNVLLYVQA